MRRCRNRSLVLGLALVALGGLAGCSGNGVTHGSDDQLRFGVQMARDGLWSEALFRFEKALRLEPDNPKVLNNVAVALEAAGRYDEALEAYRRALELAPRDRDLRQNYARFADFYESFRPPDEAEAPDLSEVIP